MDSISILFLYPQVLQNVHPSAEEQNTPTAVGLTEEHSVTKETKPK